MRIHHLNCGWLHAPPNPRASCHCLLIEEAGELALVDTGIGLLDVRQPAERLGQPLIEAAGFLFDETDTALRQIERLGFRSADVTHVLLTHGDPDHTGGLADFPEATVHVSAEERHNIEQGSWRYVPAHFAHGPRWQTHPPSTLEWYGFEARPVDIGFESEALLIPLFGHTHGHCGVAVRDDQRWWLHAGDAYYLRAELTTDDHPVSALAAARADDDGQRRATLAKLRRLVREHGEEISMCGYHDVGELPGP